MSAKSSHSAARARRTPPTTVSAPDPASAETPSGPPMQTIERSVGPNAEGHDHQIRSVHLQDEAQPPVAADTDTAQEI